VAGATVAATSLPQYIAYAELAGLSGIHGLQASGPPLVAFSFITTSPSLSIGVTSITAIMAHAALQGGDFKAANGDESWKDLLGAFSVLIGVVSIAMSLCGATRLVRYIPAAVKTGWKLGFAMTVVASQMAGALFQAGAKYPASNCSLPVLTLPGPTGSFDWKLAGGAAAVYRLGWMLSQPWLWDADTVLLSVLALVIVMYGRPYIAQALRAVTFRKVQEPVAGFEVIIATLLGTLLAMAAQYQGSVVGKVPSKNDGGSFTDMAVNLAGGWVRQMPWEMPWAALMERLGGVIPALLSAAAFASVDFLGIVSVADNVPLGRELFGQGIGCLVSGVAGSAPVGGSLSRSLVAKMTGASSPVAGFVAGLATMALAAPALAGLLAPTPKAILAAVVLAAVLPSVVYPKDMMAFKGRSAIVGWSTTACTVLADPTKGFVAGLIVHILLHPSSLKLWSSKSA